MPDHKWDLDEFGIHREAGLLTLKVERKALGLWSMSVTRGMWRVFYAEISLPQNLDHTYAIQWADALFASVLMNEYWEETLHVLRLEERRITDDKSSSSN